MSLIQDIAPDLSGLEALRKMIALGRRPSMGETLDFSLTEAGDGWAVFEATPGAKVCNPMGGVHGGYAATLLDSACGCATLSKLPAGKSFTTLELKISYQRGVTAGTGPVRAEGRVRSIGRRVAFAEAELKDSSGRLLATASSTLLILEG